MRSWRSGSPARRCYFNARRAANVARPNVAIASSVCSRAASSTLCFGGSQGSPGSRSARGTGTLAPESQRSLIASSIRRDIGDSDLTAARSLCNATLQSHTAFGSVHVRVRGASRLAARPPEDLVAAAALSPYPVPLLAGGEALPLPLPGLRCRTAMVLATMVAVDVTLGQPRLLSGARGNCLVTLALRCCIVRLSARWLAGRWPMPSWDTCAHRFPRPGLRWTNAAFRVIA